MRNLTTNGTISMIALALGALHAGGCGDGLVRGNPEFQNASQAQQIGTMLNVNGTYEDNKCIDPASSSGQKRVGATWSTAISSSPSSQPSVVLNDSGCMLDIVSLDISDSQGTTQTAAGAGPIKLGGSFLAAPVLFNYVDSGTLKPMEFFVNARIAPADFSANFDISVFYSDTPDPLTSFGLSGQWATVSAGSVSNGNEPQPADTLSFAGLTYQRDANHKISSISGSPGWTQGTPAGQSYVITTGACPSTLAAIDAAYKAGTSVSVMTAPGAVDFGLSVGLDLSSPLESCMIVANCDSNSSICAYQMFDVTFN